MGIVSWLAAGALVGWLAGEDVTGEGLGLFGNIVVAVVGALLGGCFAGTVFAVQNPISIFSTITLISAFFGARLLLYITEIFC